VRSGHLTVFQINDTHAYLEPHPELVWTSAGDSYPTMGDHSRDRYAVCQRVDADRLRSEQWDDGVESPKFPPIKG
jgi:hypothetical protein